jgi:Cu-Zn family superoxide dismutase
MIRIMTMVSAFAMALVGAFAESAAQDASPTPLAIVETTLQDVNGQEVGSATFTETPDGLVMIEVDVEGLAPGEHGIHIHETGVCDPTGDTPFASAGGHYNPTGATHDGPPMVGAMGTPEAVGAMGSPVAMSAHAGDLGNITVDDTGVGRLEISNDRFRISELNDDDGSALVVHADPDDLVTDPSGNSGSRVYCGVIFPPLDGATPTS